MSRDREKEGQEIERGSVSRDRERECQEIERGG